MGVKMKSLEDDLASMVKKLTNYVDAGRLVGELVVDEEPIRIINIDPTNNIPLTQTSYDIIRSRFMAVDCSTIPLMRANNWGIYLLRAAYALLEPPERKNIDWGFSDNVVTVIGDSHQRMFRLRDERTELESKLALDIIRKIDEGDYLLLDGAGYFGGYLEFRVELYDKCENRGVKLLAISKNAPSMLDNKGRDLIASLLRIISNPLWAFPVPTMRANKDEHRYGNTYVTKFGSEVFVALRCDVMEYLAKEDLGKLLSPLTSLAQDPRCEGYPVTLYLAHDFTRIKSLAKRLEHYDRVEDRLRQAGILDILRTEEAVASLRDRMYGVKHPFEWEASDFV